MSQNHSLLNNHSCIVPSLLFVLVLLSVCTFTIGMFMDDYTYPKWIAYFIVIGILLITEALDIFHNSKPIKISINSICFCVGVCIVLFNFDHSLQDTNVKLIAFICLYCIFKAHISTLITNCITISLFIALGISMFICITRYSCDNHIIWTGIYDSTTGFSLSLTFLIVLSVHYIINESIGYIRIPMLISVILSICTIIFMGSRVGLLALYVSIPIILKIRKMYIIIIGIAFFCLLLHWKFESTYGRLFIYKTSLSMLKVPELYCGHGDNGFRRTYMIYQSTALQKESKNVKQLADNIKHPLNEFLLFLINKGALRCICIGLLFYICFYKATLPILPKAIISVIIIFSLFSYPFRYPLTWIFLSYVLAICRSRQSRVYSLPCIPVTLIVALSATSLLVYSLFSLDWQRKWKIANDFVFFNNSSEEITKYEELSKSKFASSEFFYNYAAALLHIDNNEAALKAIMNCHIIDYDSQMLKGEIYMVRKDNAIALNYFKQASAMCPNRFSPLFYMYIIYEKTQDKTSMRYIRNLILNKDVKISSNKVNEMIEYVKKNNNNEL